MPAWGSPTSPGLARRTLISRIWFYPSVFLQELVVLICSHNKPGAVEVKPTLSSRFIRELVVVIALLQENVTDLCHQDSTNGSALIWRKKLSEQKVAQNEEVFVLCERSWTKLTGMFRGEWYSVVPETRSRQSLKRRDALVTAHASLPSKWATSLLKSDICGTGNCPIFCTSFKGCPDWGTYFVCLSTGRHT